MALPPPQSLRELDQDEQSHVLSLLFEHSPALVTLLRSDLATAAFSDYGALIHRVESRLESLVPAAPPPMTPADDAPVLDAILGSHPRLGAPKPQHLSAASRAEQAQLQAEDTPAARAQADELARLNAAYEARFPGLRYVVFVAGRPRPAVMDDMRRRIRDGDLRGERRAAVAAVCDIARDRVGKCGVATGLDEWRRRARA